MNAILLGAASLGAIAVFFTHDPHANFAKADPIAAQPPAIVETAVPTKAITKVDVAQAPKQKAATRKAAVEKSAPPSSDIKAGDKGSMTTTIELDPDTGEQTGEVSVLAFIDE